MVFQDYELVATKRVGHSRQKGFLLLKQQFNAMGGINTVYLTVFCGMAGPAFGLTSSTPLVRPLISAAGLGSIARNTLTSSGPLLLGFIVGISAFGNPAEFRNLLWNAGTYSREMKAVQKEHYY